MKQKKTLPFCLYHSHQEILLYAFCEPLSCRQDTDSPQNMMHLYSSPICTGLDCRIQGTGALRFFVVFMGMSGMASSFYQLGNKSLKKHTSKSFKEKKNCLKNLLLQKFNNFSLYPLIKIIQNTNSIPAFLHPKACHSGHSRRE